MDVSRETPDVTTKPKYYDLDQHTCTGRLAVLDTLFRSRGLLVCSALDTRLAVPGAPVGWWYIYIYIYIYRERERCIYTYICMYICDVCVYIYIYVMCVYIYIYIYIYKQHPGAV